jgi:hypothetical protein
MAFLITLPYVGIDMEVIKTIGKAAARLGAVSAVAIKISSSYYTFGHLNRLIIKIKMYIYE